MGPKISVYFLKIGLTLLFITLVFADNNCTRARDNFANSSSDFIKCSIEHSHPITFCKDCINEYITVLNSYINMAKILNNGTNCLSKFINSDRLSIVRNMYENNVDLWNRAKCYECFLNINGTQSNTTSEESIKFTELYTNYTQCLKLNEKEICSNCMDKYNNLQNYFLIISNTNDKISGCMDIVDLMNSTWTFWGEECCKYRRHNEYTFIFATVLVLIGTVVFYVVAQLYAKKRAPTIIEQTRFLDTLDK